MKKSKVYFTNLRTRPGHNLLDKFKKLVKKAGIEDLPLKNKFTAIKIHFGEPGNLAYIRPNYVRVITSIIKANKGIPFLTDANTLYTGKRSDAVRHIESALMNGFGPEVTDCPIIIADGLKGTEQKEIEINQKHVKKAKIGTAIADADIIISMNHFKGHEMAGFGGAIKNLGMGSGSRAGKLEMHSASKPFIKQKKCVACGMCVKNCAYSAIKINENKKAEIDYDKCVGCGQCIAMCMFEAARVMYDEKALNMNEKMAEYALAVLKDKPSFHINFLMNISPNCDCFSNNDVPITQDIGILASFDPVALDRACADLVNNAVPQPNSAAAECTLEQDKFSFIYPDTDWQSCLSYAEELKLGTQNYKLIDIEKDEN